MNKTDAQRNWGLVVAGILAAFLLLEAGLRLAGFVFMQTQQASNRRALNTAGAVRVLCLGESTTALGGAHAYPQLLEQILNQNPDGRVFRVINKGVPGITTDHILAGLDDTLKKYEPHVVVAMMGINDEDGDASSWEERLLHKSRVVRLLQLIGRHAAQSLPFTHAAREKKLFDEFMNSWEQGTSGEPGKAESLFRRQLRDHPDDVDAYLELANWLLVLDKDDEAMSLLDEAQRKFPDNDDIQLGKGIAYLFQDRWDDAARELYNYIQHVGYNDDAYMGLGWAFMRQGKYLQAEEILRQNLALNPTDAAFGALILCYEKQGKTAMAEKYGRLAEERRARRLLPVTQDRYRELYAELHRRGIPLVAVQYPRRDVGLLQAVLGEREGIAFVDNKASFDAAVARDGYETYFINNFAGDFGHGTATGNRLLAENVAKAVLGLVTTF
ncbi:MAG: tetratricopeptide repeat protein [Candidatus Omnitrophica bacterium]|nr:tetratricopeptide repeat protein [Candidatus Omnitrophota bacterium]